MTSPLFIVDGHMEQEIVRRLCPGTPVWRLNLNGECGLQAMAKGIGALIKRANNRHYPIVVITDRERREISIHEMEAGILDELRDNHQVDVTQIWVFVCDRTIENWILADLQLVNAELHASPKLPTEGQHGKSVLKSLFKSRTYHETIDGVELFCKVSVSLAKAQSASLRRFAEANLLDCHWIKA